MPPNASPVQSHGLSVQTIIFVRIEDPCSDRDAHYVGLNFHLHKLLYLSWCYRYNLNCYLCSRSRSKMPRLEVHAHKVALHRSNIESSDIDVEVSEEESHLIHGTSSERSETAGA